mgnify:CR=1 FL=1
MKKKYFSIVIIIVLLLSFSLTFYFYKKYQAVQKMQQKQLNPNDQKKLIAQIGKLIELPKEEPTIATVSDKEKLKGQSFFQNANNGDKVLIFTKAKKAILYRPSTNKIIEVSQINLEAPSSASVIAPTTAKIPSPTLISTSIPPSQPVVGKIVKLAIYNGTKIKGLAATKNDLILEKTKNFDIVAVDNTVKDYTENMIVNLKKVNNNVIQQLIELIPAKVVALPKGETAPADADLLLIIGKE